MTISHWLGSYTLRSLNILALHGLPHQRELCTHVYLHMIAFYRAGNDNTDSIWEIPVANSLKVVQNNFEIIFR